MDRWNPKTHISSYTRLSRRALTVCAETEIIEGKTRHEDYKAIFFRSGRNRIYLNNLPKLSELYDRRDSSADKVPDSLCTVGSLSASRGVKEAILAAHMAGARLYLAGKFSSSEFEAEIQQMPECQSVELLGFLNRDEVCSLLNRCRIGVSSILNTGQYDQAGNLPTKVYECMAMGLPVILTRNDFNEEMVRKYRFGVCVDPTNTTEFAQAIRDLLDHPDKARELGENGRRAVSQKLNWSYEEIKLLEMYHSLLESI